ncbi:MAG: prepilin-type N-terminal cleavage/methylation domain-containing protein [Gemmataceae bacterium]|nr:prepilin-type N-terminal cleavage/methylation domain-containing protein [Gemmataceae bacterium]MDW8266975.1 prepilin-type N-terminal cleavage/methylation domain-containing protein [Gemmataceae bacterium]
MTRRPGVSLTEVLVALFVMAIGMMGLLTLFPLGALTMAQAIRDDRCAHIARNAFAIAEARGIRFNSWVGQNLPSTYSSVPNNGRSPLHRSGPSIPVFVDPYGIGPLNVEEPAESRLIPWDSITRPLGGVIPRRSVHFCNTATQVARWCSLRDDINFGPNGTPFYTSPVQVDGRYSWAWLLRKPKSADGNRIEVTVIVYNARPMGSAGQGEIVSPASGAKGGRTVLIPSDVPIKRGNWIMDISPELPELYGPAHGFFYRVIGVTQTSGGMVLDLQTVLKAPVSRILIMDGVVEVFEKGMDRLPRAW